MILLALSEEFELGQRDGGEEVLAHAESVQDDLVELGASSTSEESVELKKEKISKMNFFSSKYGFYLKKSNKRRNEREREEGERLP